MNTLSDFAVEKKTSGHHACPFCGSSDALHVDDEEGDTGVYYCFSCGEGGTGAQYLVHAEGYTLREALEAFGVDSYDGPTARSDARSYVQHKRKERKRKMQKLEQHHREVYRLLPHMTDAERARWSILCKEQHNHPRTRAVKRNEREALLDTARSRVQGRTLNL